MINGLQELRYAGPRRSRSTQGAAGRADLPRRTVSGGLLRRRAEQLTSPYIIDAIGDPHTLQGALEPHRRARSPSSTARRHGRRPGAREVARRHLGAQAAEKLAVRRARRHRIARSGSGRRPPTVSPAIQPSQPTEEPPCTPTT